MTQESAHDAALTWEMGNTIPEDWCRAPYDTEAFCRRQFKHNGDHAFGHGESRVEWPVIYCDAVNDEEKKCQLWSNHLSGHALSTDDGTLVEWEKDIPDRDALHAWIDNSS